MTYTAYCKTKCFITDENSTPYTKSYDFWKAMIQKISQVATEFEIRCWKNEALAIEIGEKFGECVNNFETEEIVYQGKITVELISEILNNYLTEDGRLKWFSIFFKKDKKTIFSSEHYGTEIIILGITEKEIDVIKDFSKKFKEVDYVHIFEEKIEE
ncbi:MAG: hypothetical protein BWY74_02466 [Firmicutes bacterium ADurb.Bin419]|nr:MAG: hypothetical protein BWY74_02466 [Firmicutes bacterium ADurb.Bin419]